MGAHIHAMYTCGSQGTIWRSGFSFLLENGSQELSSGDWAWQQAFFPDESAPPPLAARDLNSGPYTERASIPLWSHLPSGSPPPPHASIVLIVQMRNLGQRG